MISNDGNVLRTICLRLLLISFPVFQITGGTQTYHVAFLGLDTPTTASLQFLQVDGTTATTRLNNCETLEFNTELTHQTNPCISDLFPQGSNVVDSRAVKIETSSEDPVHINVKHNDNDEGFLAIPDFALGTEYYVATFCRFGGYCQFSVTPVEDGTSVMIRFPVAVSGAQVCINGVDVSGSSSADIPFLLDEFDVLHFESTNDLTGTHITSNKRVALFSGARNVPSIFGGPATHMIEQLPPVNKWGTEFLVVPNINNPAGDEFIILASEASTKVQISGYSPFVIPHAGQFITRRIDWGMYSKIDASYPVLVVQMMSIDIYNDSASVQGSPSMLLAQSIGHFVNKYTFDIGENPISDASVFIAIVAKTSAKNGITATDTTKVSPSLSGTWSQIGNTDMWVVTSAMSGAFQQISHGTLPFGLYGYFGRSRASLISMSWNEEAEVCTKSASAPGDGIDNDCNGEIDEDTTCTQEDLSNSFTINATTTARTIPVGGLDHVTFAVRSCDLVFVSLSTPELSETYFLVELSPERIHAHECDSDCDGAVGQSDEKDMTRAADFNCSATAISYWISWSDDFLKVDEGVEADPGSDVALSLAILETPETTLRELAHAVYRDFFQPISWSDNFLKIDEGEEADPGSDDALSLAILETPETISFSTLHTDAEITTDITGKDCDKIISGQPDNSGTVFYIPVEGTDESFTLYMTPAEAMTGIAIRIRTMDGTQLQSNPSVISQTWEIEKSMLNPLSWGSGSAGLRVEATGGEIQVYVIRKIQTKVTGFHVLPMDICGARYMIASHTDTNVANDHTGILLTQGYDVEVNGGDFQALKYTLHKETGFTGMSSLSKPAAIFSARSAGDIITQMPPVETLGKTHYIPAIDLTSLSATGMVIVTSTEDSTYVIIKGAYDQGYEIAYEGDEERRPVDENTKMTIESSKPVLVSLLLEDTNGQWNTMVTIPPTDQYTTQHTFPAMPDFELVSSVSVTSNGLEVTSQIEGSSALSNIQTKEYTPETFTLTFLRSTSTTYQNAMVVVKSDEGVSMVNTVCTLTTATVGDGKDNDCDGLKDEEYCYSNDTPGYIDYDIDGEFNEDCSEQGGTYTPSSTLTFNIVSTSAPCPTTSTPSSTASPTVPGGSGSGSLGTAIPTLPHGSGYSDPTITFQASTVVGSPVTTTPASGATTVAPVTATTAAPVETCVTDCICPCGWVNVQNYTAEEIQQKVVEIQQKLKIDKAILSASVRKKTSAQDSRPTAMGIGYVGLVFLIVTIGSVFLLDLTSITRDIRLLKDNLRDVFDT